MQKVVGCPAPDHIDQLINGQLPPDAVELLLEHLQACPKCIPAMQRLTDSTIASDLRAAATLPDSPDPPRLRKLMHALIARQPAPPDTQRVELDSPTHDHINLREAVDSFAS